MPSKIDMGSTCCLSQNKRSRSPGLGKNARNSFMVRERSERFVLCPTLPCTAMTSYAALSSVLHYVSHALQHARFARMRQHARFASLAKRSECFVLRERSERFVLCPALPCHLSCTMFRMHYNMLAFARMRQHARFASLAY